MRIVGHRDESRQVEHRRVALFQRLRIDRVHVVDQNPVRNLKSGNREITSGVTRYDLSTNALPGRGRVEALIQPAQRPEGLAADCASAHQVCEAFLVAIVLQKLIVRQHRPNQRSRRT